MVANELSRSYVLVSTLISKLMRFDQINGLCANDLDFWKVFAKCKFGPYDRLNLQDRFILRKISYVPNFSLHELFVKEAHYGLMGYIGLHKTLDILVEQFFFPGM